MNTHHTRHLRRTQRALRRGFSLLEVIVAVTIIALFAALVAPSLLGRVGEAKVNKARVEATSIAQQVQIYLTDNDQTSTGEDFALQMLVPKYFGSTDDLIDPWGNPYVIDRPDANGRDFDIVSLGSDGARGGEDEAADIVHGKERKSGN
jgi:general secretion pathway protein G